MKNDSLKNKAISGIFWKLSERILAQFISFFISVLLARRLFPEDYLSVSVVGIFFTFANVIISGGLNTALIQKKSPTKDDYNTVFTISIIGSVIITVILFLLAPVISKWYDNSQLTAVLRVMSLSLPIYAIKSIICAYISNKLLFKSFFFATLGGTIASGIVGVVLADMGFGAWALVCQQLTNTVIDTVILFAMTKIKIRFGFSIDSFSSLFKYGWKIFASSIIGVIYSETSPLIVGLKFSGTDLTYYEKGRNIPSIIANSTTATLSAVLFPVLSKNQDDKTVLLNQTRTFMKVSSFLVFPAMMGFMSVTDNFVSVILTDKWLGCSFFMKIFCLIYMFDIVAIGNCETIKAMGRSDINLKIDIIKKSLYMISIVIFTIFSDSPEVFVISAIVNTIVQVIVNSIPNIKLLGYSLKLQILDLLPNLIISCIMSVIVQVLGIIMPDGSIIALTLQVVCGIVSYLILALIFKNSAFSYCFNQVKSYFGTSK